MTFIIRHRFVAAVILVFSLATGHAQIGIPQLDSVMALSNDTNKVRTLELIAREMSRVNHPDLMVTLEKGEAIARELGDEQGLGDFNRGLSYAKFNAGDFNDAADHTHRAIQHYENAGSEKLVNILRLELAGDEYYAGNYDTASTLALEVLQYYKEIDYKIGVARVYTLLSRISRALDDFARAENYDRQSLAISRAIDKPLSISRSLANLAETLMSTDRLEVARPLADEALEIARNKYIYEEYIALGIIGAIDIEEKQFAKALESFERMAEIEGGDRDVITMFRTAQAYQHLDRSAEARALLHQVLNIYQSQEVAEGDRLEVYKLLQARNLNREQLDTMFYYQAAAEKLRENMQEAANRSTLLDLETKYETAEKEAAITLRDSQLDRQRQVLYIVGVGLLLALAAGVAFFVLSRRLRRQNAANERLVGEKETLIGEIHHRVKNNLQVISSLLQLQSRGLSPGDSSAREALRESQSRVQAMGLIHQRLYQGQGAEVTRVNMSHYLEELGETMLDAYRLDDRVEIFYDIEPVTVDVDLAIPLGLITNELLTNALKYAFPEGRPGTIEVQFYRENDQLYLRVSDDGVGGDDSEVSVGGTGFGTNLIALLTDKLKGTKRRLEGTGFGTEIVVPE